jgi:hypothetical protein
MANYHCGIKSYNNLKGKYRMGIIDNVKDIAGIIQKADNIELYGKIIGLQGDIMKMMEDMNQLKEKNKALLKLQDISEKMVFKDSFWYYNEEKAPSCPKCWDTENIISHLTRLADSNLHCPSCGIRYVINDGLLVNIYKKYDK